MQDVRKVQSRAPVFGGGNPALASNSAGLVDEEGFSYKDLLQQFKDGQNKSTQQQTNGQNLKQVPVPKMPLGAAKTPPNMMSPFSTMNRPMMWNPAPTAFVSSSHAMGSYTKQTGKSLPTPTSQKSTGAPSKGDSAATRSTNMKSPMSTPSGIVPWSNQDATKGDVNFDGQVSKTDKDLMAEYVVRKVLDEYFHTDMADKFAKENNLNVYAADIDSDGKVNLSDFVDLDSIVKEIEDAKVNKQAIEDAKRVIKGDLNDDGDINGDDIDLMKDYLAKNNVSVNNKAADFNDDGKISAADLSELIYTFNEIKKQKANGIRGDLNNDGMVDSDDVLKLSNYISGKDKGYDIYNDADVDGNGEIDEADGESIKNLYLYGKLQKSTGVAGDIDNDGSVNANDQELLNRYLNGEVDYDKINNEDVNGDGTVDRNDARNLSNLVRYGKMEKPTDINGDINNDGRVDAADIDKLKDMFEGRESHINVYNANVNADDVVDQRDMEALENLINYGSITKPEPPPPPPPPEPKPYQQWNSFATARIDVYEDSGLNNHLGNEKVFEGDPVDVLEENDNAYLIRYGVGTYPNYSSYKERWIEKWAIDGTNKPSPQADNPAPQYQQWQAVISNRVPAYQDPGLTNRIGNEEVWVNDPVDVLNETDNAYYVRYGVGTYPNYSEYKLRWITKSAINGVTPVNPTPSNGYQPWEATVQARMPAYHDANLTDRRNNEEVWVGDKVTILEETDNAYKMRYWSNVANDYKDRWVSKVALNPVSEPTPAPAPSYQPWEATVQTRMPAYHDANLTDRRNNEEVWVGDKVTILDETDRAFKMKYWSDASNAYKERWVDKAALSSTVQVNPAPAPSYQPWEATVQTRTPAYHDANLTDRRNNEEVWVGDKVTILDETDRAFKMKYWSDASNAYKERWVDKAALSGTTQVNPTPSPSYQPWEATVQARMPAYHDSNLIDRRNNEEVWVGDKVTVLDETDRAFKMKYWSDASNAYKERWVDKAAILGVAPYVDPANKSGWTAYAHYKKQVFTDSNLTKTSGYEYVDAQEKVTIVDESDKSYKIRYWSTAINNYKERWIDKIALTEPIPPSANDGGAVSQKLNQLHSGTVGFRDGDVYKGSGQCRGFANQVYNELFGLSGISGYSNYNYAASNYPGSHVAGQLYNFGSNDTGAVQQLFSNVQPGAMVQMGRRGRLNSTGDAASPHTAIVYSVNSAGVEFYEANVAGNNVVKVKFYSWADLAKKNEGFTVYMPDNYPTQSAHQALTLPSIPDINKIPRTTLDTNKKEIHDKSLDFLRNNNILDIFTGAAKVVDKVTNNKGLNVFAEWISTYNSLQDLYSHEKRDASWGHDAAILAKNAIKSIKTSIDFLGSLDSKSKAALLKDIEFVKGLGIGQAAMGAVAALIATTDGVSENELEDVAKSIANMGVEFEKLVNPIRVGPWSPGEIIVAFAESAIKGQQEYEQSLKSHAISLDRGFVRASLDSSITQLATIIHNLSWGVDEKFFGSNYEQNIKNGLNNMLDGFQQNLVKTLINMIFK